jgi:integrase
MKKTENPFGVFLSTCSPRSRPTMRARLAAAARILRPSGRAETFAWERLDHRAVMLVLATLGEARASAATRNLTRAALRKMARVLFSQRLIDVEERQRIDDVPAVRGKRVPRGRALTQGEVRRLFVACEKDQSAAGRRDAALVAVLYGGGLRRDEASQLDVGDFDGRRRWLRVKGKGGRDRLQPIGEEVVSALRAWIVVRGRRAGPLFLTVDKLGRIGDGRLRGAAIEWKVKRLAERAKIEPTSPHDLRRTFVTSLLEAGEDLATVSKAAAHRSIATTSIYDRRDERVVEAAVAKLPVPFGQTRYGGETPSFPPPDRREARTASGFAQDQRDRDASVSGPRSGRRRGYSPPGPGGASALLASAPRLLCRAE